MPKPHFPLNLRSFRTNYVQIFRESRPYTSAHHNLIFRLLSGASEKCLLFIRKVGVDRGEKN